MRINILPTVPPRFPVNWTPDVAAVCADFWLRFSTVVFSAAAVHDCVRGHARWALGPTEHWRTRQCDFSCRFIPHVLSNFYSLQTVENNTMATREAKKNNATYT